MKKVTKVYYIPECWSYVEAEDVWVCRDPYTLREIDITTSLSEFDEVDLTSLTGRYKLLRHTPDDTEMFVEQRCFTEISVPDEEIIPISWWKKFLNNLFNIGFSPEVINRYRKEYQETVEWVSENNIVFHEEWEVEEEILECGK